MEEFVTYEIAVKLKEKGFTKPCRFYYSGSSVFPNQRFQLLSRNTTDDNSLDAPTISQVLKWLREEKCLHIEIQYIFSEETIWEFEVVRIGSYERWWNGSESLDSYEQAAIAGVEYVLNNLI